MPKPLGVLLVDKTLAGQHGILTVVELTST